MKRSIVVPAIAALISATATFAAPVQAHDRVHGHHWQEHAAKHWEKLKADLKLNPAQDFAWQQIADKRAALHEEHRNNRMQLKEAMKNELAKPEPDFARIVQQKQQVEEKNMNARNELRDLQLKLYSSFNPEQKAVIRDVIKARMERMEQRRDKKRSAS